MISKKYLIIILSVLTIAACKKDNKQGKNANTSPATLLAKAVYVLGKNDTIRIDKYIYNANNKVTKNITFTSGGNGFIDTATYSYDGAGNITNIDQVIYSLSGLQTSHYSTNIIYHNNLPYRSGSAALPDSLYDLEYVTVGNKIVKVYNRFGNTYDSITYEGNNVKTVTRITTSGQTPPQITDTYTFDECTYGDKKDAFYNSGVKWYLEIQTALPLSGQSNLLTETLFGQASASSYLYNSDGYPSQKTTVDALGNVVNVYYSYISAK